MKRTIQLTIIFVVTFGLVSCGIVSQKTSAAEIPEQSTFKENFSIGDIIEAHTDLLVEGPRTLSGMEAGPREPFVQCQEYMVVQVDDDNAADLMQAIQADIQGELTSSGANILGGGADFQPDAIAYFSQNYSDGEFYGAITVWAVKGPENNLNIIVLLTETSN